MKPRAIVYIDGFNLYYGVLKDSRFRWLDIERLFGFLRADDQLVLVKYFTARVAGDSGRRQAAYLRALQTLPLVKIIEGKYKSHEVKCRVQCGFRGLKIFQKPEEKRTDVNISIEMLDDAYQNACDRLVLVSGDSDLVPAVERVRMRFPNKRVIVYVPANNPVRGAATELRSAATQARDLPTGLLQKSQLPSPVMAGRERSTSQPHGRSAVNPGAPWTPRRLAGFEVTTTGRFEVTTEVAACQRKEVGPGWVSFRLADGSVFDWHSQ